MKRNTTWTLSALLVLQLVAAVLLTVDYGSQTQGSNEGALLTANTDQIDGIRIEEPGQPALELHKSGDSWKLPSYYDLPAQDFKLKALLSKLDSLQRNWPVASTETSASRFEVAAQKHQRKVELKQGEQTLATLYLGTSPGMRKTHVRLEGEEAVYALDIAHHDAPIKGQDWVVTDLVQVNTADLTGIQGSDFSLSRSEDRWQLDGLSEQEITDEQAVHNLLSGIRNLRFSEVMGTQAQPEFGLQQPAFQLELQRDGGHVTYAFGKPENADYYVLKTSEQAPYFKIPAAQLEQIINLKRASLAKAKPEALPETQEESEATG